MELLGHASISLTMNTYRHVLEEMKHETARKMDDVLNPRGCQFGGCEGELKVKSLWNLARPEGLEPPAYWFEASRSIQLSYGRALPRF